MESTVQLPRYVVFDLSSGDGLRCFSAAPAVEHIGVPFHTLQVLGVEALHRAWLSRVDDLAAHRPFRQQQAATATKYSCDQVHISDDDDLDTVSDAGTSGVHVVAEEYQEDEEADSFDELFFQESFARKIDALAQLVGMDCARSKPAAVLGEVVRVLQGGR